MEKISTHVLEGNHNYKNKSTLIGKNNQPNAGQFGNVYYCYYLMIWLLWIALILAILILHNIYNNYYVILDINFNIYPF